MTKLLNSIKCSDKDIVLGTDTATHNREIYNNARSRTDSKTQCCKINIEKCLPQPAMDVSFEDILDFKVRRKDVGLFQAFSLVALPLQHRDNPKTLSYIYYQF